MKSFFFRNVMGLLKFTVGSETGMITSVTVSANGSETLAGDVLVDCSLDNLHPEPETGVSEVILTSDTVLEEGDYYIALLPGVYAEGLTFTWTGPDGTAVKKIDRELILERGHIQPVNLDGLTWAPDAAYYTKVDKTYDDWSRDYLITYSSSSAVTVFNSFSSNDKGGSTVDLISVLSAEGIPVEDGDPYKAVISKVGDYYGINITTFSIFTFIFFRS